MEVGGSAPVAPAVVKPETSALTRTSRDTGVSAAAANAAATWYSKAFGSAKAMALSGRALDDYEGSAADDIEAGSIVPVMLEGKIAQATLFATHAYAEEEDFRKNTGLTNARLLSCDEQDTQVRRARYPYLSVIIRVLSGLIVECQTEQCRIPGSVFLLANTSHFPVQ